MSKDEIADRIVLPTLSRGPVTLRLHRPDDVQAALECFLDPQSRAWSEMPTAPTVEAYGRWIADVAMVPTRELALFAIDVEDRFAGQVGLRAHGDGGGVFYITSPWVRGSHVAATATVMVTEWALQVRGWSAVIWQAHVGNIASAKTAWRAGFLPPIVVPKGLALQGRLVDAWHSVKDDPTSEPVGPWERYLP